MRIGLSLLVVILLASVNALAAGSDPTPSEASEIAKARDAIKLKDFAAAEMLLKKAVAADPKSAEAWNLLGFSTRKQERLQEAEGYYDKALALEPEHVGALEYLGMLYVKTGRIDEAKALLKRIDKACFFTCDEFKELEEAINTGKAE